MGSNKFCGIMSEFLPQRAQLSYQIYTIRFFDKTANLMGSSGFRSEEGQLRQKLGKFSQHERCSRFVWPSQ